MAIAPLSFSAPAVKLPVNVLQSTSGAALVFVNLESIVRNLYIFFLSIRHNIEGCFK